VRCSVRGNLKISPGCPMGFTPAVRSDANPCSAPFPTSQGFRGVQRPDRLQAKGVLTLKLTLLHVTSARSHGSGLRSTKDKLGIDQRVLVMETLSKRLNRTHSSAFISLAPAILCEVARLPRSPPQQPSQRVDDLILMSPKDRGPLPQMRALQLVTRVAFSPDENHFPCRRIPFLQGM